MKDKLYKTGHKKAYYRLRAALRITGLSLAIALSTAAPVLITYGVEQSRAEAAQASEESSEESASNPIQIASILGVE